jgi:deoxyribodipyrimidine photo-lyase
MTTTLLWLRRDLRLADHPALHSALQAGAKIIPVYIHAPEEEAPWAPGAASRWWLHGSLASLDAELRRLGSRLIFRLGPSLQALRQLAQETRAERVCWSRLYEPACTARDTAIKQALRGEGLRVDSHNAALLYEPWENARGGGEPYKVFTPFWKALQKRGLDFPALPAPTALPPVPSNVSSLNLASLGLLPRIPWDAGLRENWQPGENGAQARLRGFIETALHGYAQARDRPDQAGSSGLSPHLHFGEISPRQIIQAIGFHESAASPGAESFARQLAWREFAHHLLFYFPNTPEQPLDARFERFPWREDSTALQAWQQGKTGIPWVDAGMRELWHTGAMHNRARMAAASLLVKNLRIPWREGACWFWDTLIDADLANNTLGWQWVAGCGADAAPYFRIFNPVLQGERFDSEGVYMRRWLPELARLPAAYLHQPWLASPAMLAACGLRLGVDYPHPLVELKSSREAALAAYRSLGA